ncbi:MAG TPA: hypothetical protein VKV17_10030 [Bryobacteraceae bacterium]|nr:hypothetical protein [Bryobacteraceae bacterium]
MSDVIHDIPPRVPHTAMPRWSETVRLQKVSWGAIWAGLMVTLGMEGLFLSFGLFIGAALGGSLAWSAVWYLVTMAVSFYAGARTAARLSGIGLRDLRILHGLTTWGVATLANIVAVAWLVPRLLDLAFVSSGSPPAAIIERFLGTDSTVGWGALVWGGIILSLATAYMGGGSALPANLSPVKEQSPPGSTGRTELAA